MNWIKKTLLFAFLLPALISCGGSDGDDDDNINAKHHYRIELEFEGDMPAYITQVVISVIKDYEPNQADKFVNMTLDGEEIAELWKTSAQLYHFTQATSSYPNTAHNFTFSKEHVFETVEKGVLLTFEVDQSDLRRKEEAAPGPVTTRIRVYRDNKLVDEIENTVGGRNAKFTYGPKQF